MTEIIFEVCEDEVDGGFNARALGTLIFTQGDTLEDVRAMVKEAVACHFGDRAHALGPDAAHGAATTASSSL